MSSDRERRRQETGGRRAPGRPTPRAVKRAIRRGPAYERPRLVLGRLNYTILAGAGAFIVIGFLLLHSREISLAAFLLVLGYCILVPAAFLIERLPTRRRQEKPEEGAPE